MAMDSSDRISEVLVDKFTDLQAKLQTVNEVLNVMDWAIESALEELQANGSISAQGGLLEEYKEAIKHMRKKGFRRPIAQGQQGVKCPGCQALLKNIDGNPGDRCDWCGYVFK